MVSTKAKKKYNLFNGGQRRAAEFKEGVFLFKRQFILFLSSQIKTKLTRSFQMIEGLYSIYTSGRSSTVLIVKDYLEDLDHRAVM